LRQFHWPVGKNVTFAMLLALTLLLFLRAYPRLLGPEVWDEDGTHNLYGFINFGFGDIFTPVNGYLIVVPKLITYLSASISFVQYPLISTILAWVVILAVLLIVAIAPMQLRGRWMLAILCLLIPSDPEVFGLPLYTFWWTSLLLYVCVFWINSHHYLVLRISLILFATLSSPVCITTLPLFWIRGYFYRQNRNEILLAVIATIGAVIQLFNMYLQNSENAVATGLNINNLFAIGQILPKFFGAYVLGNIKPEWQAAMGAAVIFLLLFSFYNRRSFVIFGLAYLLLMAILMSISRVDISSIHQIQGGPRYFFFPFVLLSWWLLQIAITGRFQWMKLTARIILVVTVANVWPVMNRKHDELNWSGHVYSCQFYQNYILPVHFDGKSSPWELAISGEQCKKLLSKDPFGFNQTS
jgi:hypothetical protein